MSQSRAFLPQPLMCRVQLLARHVGVGNVRVYVHAHSQCGRSVIVEISQRGAWAGKGDTIEQATGMGLAWALCGLEVVDGNQLVYDADVFALGLAFQDRLRELVVPDSMLVALATSRRAAVRTAGLMLVGSEGA